MTDTISRPADPGAGDLERPPFRWGPWSASAVILVAVAVGQALGMLVRPLFLAARDGPGATITWGGLARAPRRYVAEHGFGLEEWVLAALALSSLGWIVLQRAALLRFFRSMWTGVALIGLTTLAVIAGVLVPQLDGFEDPDLRVTAANREYHYDGLPGLDNAKSFRHAEAYFAYHLLHLYGIGMPPAELPPGVTDGLDRFGRRYGSEERDNYEKRMLGAFRSQPKMREVYAFAAEHDALFRRLFAVCTWLELNRVYKSSWFATLLLLLAIGMLCNTFKGNLRALLKPAKLGFVLVHLGMLTVLAGGFVSKLTTERGIVHLDLRDPPASTYLRHYDREQEAELPFSLGLEHFARKEWLGLEVRFRDEAFSSRPPRYTLWPGRVIDLDYPDPEDVPVVEPHGFLERLAAFLRPGYAENRGQPRLRIVVRETYDRARVALPHIREAEPDYAGPTLPTIELQVPAVRTGDEPGAAEVERLYLLPAVTGGAYIAPDERFRLRATDTTDPEREFPRSDDVLGQLWVLVAGQDPEPEPHEVVIGREVALAGGFRLAFERATKQLTRDGFDPRPLAEQPLGKCAVQVLITGPDGHAERRGIFEGLDAVSLGLQERYHHREVLAQLEWDRWTAPGGPRYVLSWGPGREPRLFAEDGSASVVQVGTPLALPEGPPVVVLRFYERAAFEQNIELEPPTVRADGWDEDFYSSDPRGLVLDVIRDPDTAEERVETVRMATTAVRRANRWISDDERIELAFFENVESMPQDWRSVLAIIEEGPDGRPREVPLGPEKAREIRVNDYFKYGGWRFFQTNADARFPTYSGIGVVYDPGIPVVLTGMYVAIAGAVVAFIVRPILRARRRTEASG